MGGMTNEERFELERKISELREPKPQAALVQPKEILRWLSDGGAWLYQPWHSISRLIFVPRPWTTDEAASAVLRDEMNEIAIYKLGGKWFAMRAFAWSARCENTINGVEGEPLAEHIDFKVAIALAWLRWKESEASK